MPHLACQALKHPATAGSCVLRTASSTFRTACIVTMYPRHHVAPMLPKTRRRVSRMLTA
jgi:hypothetical protein